MTQTIAVTGASAGIGRAAARLFAQRGDCVPLIARGHAGMEGAVRDVEREGGVALAFSAEARPAGRPLGSRWMIRTATTTARTGEFDDRSI